MPTADATRPKRPREIGDAESPKKRPKIPGENYAAVLFIGDLNIP